MLRSCSRCGKAHEYGVRCRHNWKQYEFTRREVASDSDKLRATYVWEQKSKEIRKNSRYLCEICEESNVYQYKKLSVHHIYSLNEAPERWLDNSNLICLCELHHKLAEKGNYPKDYLESLARRREQGIPPCV